MASRAAGFRVPEPPPGFQVARKIAMAHHPLLRVFPGLDGLPTAARLQPDSAKRNGLFERTQVALVDEDLWMYVAPRKLPQVRRAGWKPVIVPRADCIVIGLDHLRESPDFTLFMDIFHELRHVIQRQEGAKLFGRSESYVRRPTEVDAYRFVVEEARRLGASDAYLRDYLRVEWIDDGEFQELLTALDIPGS